MTRDDQIEKAANELYPPLSPSWSGTENQAFQNGAEFADSTNPQVQEFKSKCFSLEEVIVQQSKKHEAKVRVLTEALEGKHEGCSYLAALYCNKCGSFPARKALEEISEKK